MTRRWLRSFVRCAIALAAIAGGCSRAQYRERADREAYALLAQKTAGTPWNLPPGFTIEPDRRSRLHDPGDPDHPALPDPGPALYAYEPPLAAGEPPKAEPPAAKADASAADPPESGSAREGRSRSVALRLQPIPKAYWEALPPGCFSRMVEFESVRDEYRRPFHADPPAESRDASPRLGLEEVIDLALLNSREYQAQKEALYRTALALSRERFGYGIHFTESGNGTDIDYAYARSGGTPSETLGFRSGAGLSMMLWTGGEILARFANRVVLTFEGPRGFSKDVGSELIFDVSQSLLQRDVRLNPLIQAERNLVYAARDYARYRKQLYVDLAGRYYGLLQTYRSIEIESQNYFSLIRTFEQAQAEVRAGVQNAPNPVAVDQYEQGMLSGRSGLISTANRLEASLDALKLAIGLPTETPIQIDLEELEKLTLLDETEVAAERVRRWRARVRDAREAPRRDRAEILNGDIFLTERLLEWLRLRERLGESVPEKEGLEGALAVFRVDLARLEAARNEGELRRAEDPAARAPAILIYQRRSDLIDARIALARLQARLAGRRGSAPEKIAEAGGDLAAAEADLDALRGELASLLQDPKTERFGALLARTGTLRDDLARRNSALELLLGGPAEGIPDEERRSDELRRTDALLEKSGALLAAETTALPAIEIGMDEMLATALVQRLDLMNERGRLADDWRRIKLAADDLKTIINLQASHTVGTRDRKPFAFTYDENRTTVGLSIDLPLNRLEQRNVYRQSLIEYRAGRRSLMALEDQIKFDIRNGRRGLDETRIQYPIAVTQAALAAEQVISVRLQLALGIQGVRGTDLLDALQASRRALLSVANARFGYIVDRARFALDLEHLRLDERGMWPEIDDLGAQIAPDTRYPAGAGPVYGEIPSFLNVSREIRSQLDYPPPGDPRGDPFIPRTDWRGGRMATNAAAIKSAEAAKSPTTESR